MINIYTHSILGYKIFKDELTGLHYIQVSKSYIKNNKVEVNNFIIQMLFLSEESAESFAKHVDLECYEGNPCTIKNLLTEYYCKESLVLDVILEKSIRDRLNSDKIFLYFEYHNNSYSRHKAYCINYYFDGKSFVSMEELIRYIIKNCITSELPEDTSKSLDNFCESTIKVINSNKEMDKLVKSEIKRSVDYIRSLMKLSNLNNELDTIKL